MKTLDEIAEDLLNDTDLHDRIWSCIEYGHPVRKSHFLNSLGVVDAVEKSLDKAHLDAMFLGGEKDVEEVFFKHKDKYYKTIFKDGYWNEPEEVEFSA